MNVYFIGGQYEGCYYARCFVPMCGGGWDGYRLSFQRPPKNGRQIAREGMQNDVIVFHRPFETQRIQAMKLFKKAGKKIVLDNDDTYMPNSGTPTKIKGMDTKKVIEVMNNNLYEASKLADLVTVSTQPLKEEYEKIHDNVKVMPNMVDPFDWPTPKRNETDVVRVGLWGSVARQSDCGHITELLEELSDRKDVQLVVLSFPASKEKRETYQEDVEFWQDLDAEIHYNVPLVDYRDKLNDLRLDIGLIPRDDHYFNRAKSNIKFLEASMVETAVVAQGFEDNDSPYERNETDRKHLRVANSLNEWREAVNELIDSIEDRKRLAKRARQYVKDAYNIHKNIHLWENAYKSLIN